MKKIMGYSKKSLRFFLWTQVWLFCSGTNLRSASTNVIDNIIYEDPVATGLADITQVLSLQPNVLDNSITSVLKIIKSLKGLPLISAFHYIRELKNILKVSTSITCPNVCLILKEMLTLWKNNLWNNATTGTTSGVNIDEDTLSEDLLDFAIDQHIKLKREPDVFFKDLATKIIQKYDKSSNHEVDITPHRLGQEIYTIIELLLCKMTLSVSEYERIWFDIWELTNLLDNVAKYGIIDEEDYYQDFFCSIQARLIIFLNSSSSGTESGKSGYKLPATFFTQGLLFVDNELSFCPHLKCLSGELNTWVAKKLSQGQATKERRSNKKLVNIN